MDNRKGKMNGRRAGRVRVYERRRSTMWIKKLDNTRVRDTVQNIHRHTRAEWERDGNQ